MLRILGMRAISIGGLKWKEVQLWRAYLLPIGVPQNVAAHDMDDIRLWVYFAH